MRKFAAALGKRALIAAYDVAGITLIACLMTFAAVKPAWAYVDPSVMTYTIQALAGVAVALSAVAGVAFRRTRKALFKMLNIDEDARKEHDAAWNRTDDGATMQVKLTGPAAARLAAAAGAEATEVATATTVAAEPSAKRQDAPLPWLRRFLIALLAVAFPGITVGIVAPFEIVAGNLDALSFSLTDVAGILALAVGAAVVVVALVLSLFRGKLFTVGAVIAVAGGLCFWVQAMFLNSGMPVMNGTAINYWGDHTAMMIISAIVWLAILGAALFCSIKFTKRTRITALTVAAVLLVVQMVGVVSLFSEKDNNLFVTEDGLYEVSESGNNVVVFVLDHFDTKFFYEVLEQYPEALAEFEGFTWYSDNSGMMLPTLFAVPYMLTGETPQVGQDIHQYYTERYLNSSLIDDLTSTGWSLGLYTSDIQESYFTEDQVQELFANKTQNVHAVEGLTINKVGALKILIRAALFRDMPWVLKSPFWFYTDALNQRTLDLDTVKVDENGNYVLGDTTQTPYIIDDVLRATELDAFGLTAVQSTGAIRLIHLNGAHLPFTMNYDAQRVPQDSVTQIEQAAGALRIVGTYLAMLKELGLYEDATIIITADHGDWKGGGDMPTMVSCPLLLVKESGDATSELVQSTKQVSHANMIATMVAAVGADASAYGPTLADAPQTSTRYFYQISTVEDRVKEVYEYVIEGDSSDMANWHYTGNKWVVEGGVAD